MSAVEQIPGKLDITLVKGDYYSLAITVTDTDLSTYTLSAELGGLPMIITETDLPNGAVNLSLTSEQTTTLKSGVLYSWFFQWSVAGNVRTVLAGDVTVLEGHND